MTVDDGGDLAGSAQAAGEALAELLADLCVDLGVLRHEFSFGAHGELLAARWSCDRLPDADVRKSHGAEFAASITDAAHAKHPSPRNSSIVPDDPIG
ncbi:hypothetical protein GCM10009803_26680 [Microbacterium ginsengiterrae]